MSTEKSLEDQASDLFAAGNYAAAEPLYRTMLEEEPDNPQLLLMLGLCRRGQGDGASALEMIRRSAQSKHSDDLSHFYLGQMLMEQNQPDQAREALGQCISMNPNHGLARTLLGYLELMDGQTDQAIESLQTALRAIPDHVPALSTLALALLEKGKLERAHDHAQQAVKLKPDDAGAQAALGQVFLAQGHTDFAEKCVRNALEKHPQNPELHAALAGILRRQGHHVDAVGHFAQAARVGHGGPRLLIDMSESLIQIGRLEDARKLLEQLHQNQPDDPALGLLLAQVRLDSGDASDAEALLAGLDQDNPQARLLNARLAESRNDYPRAREYLAGLDQSDNNQLAEHAQLLIGRMALAEGQTDEAEQALKPLTERDRPQPVASMMLFELYRQVDEPDQACGVLERLLKQSSLNPVLQASCHQALAGLLDEQGQYDRAAVHIGKTGHSPAPIMRQLVTATDKATHAAWLDEAKPDWSAPDDGLPSPVVVMGWPGSGRGLLLEALSVHQGIQMLTTDQGRQRAASLLMPADPDRLKALSDDEIRQGRRDYLSPAIDQHPGNLLIESVWWENANLASLARFFPGATVLIPEAELADLELMWRLSGFGDIGHMIDLWQTEARLLEHLRSILPLNFISISRGELLEDPDHALRGLCSKLAIDYQDAMAERFDQALVQMPLRDDGHWTHYRQVLMSASDPQARVH
jgi:tetratricopeptide (TPR) repeat protein